MCPMGKVILREEIMDFDIIVTLQFFRGRRCGPNIDSRSNHSQIQIFHRYEAFCYEKECAESKK